MRAATQVDRDADDGDDHDDSAVYARRRDESGDGVVDDQQREHEERDAVRLGAEDLDPAEAERHRAARRPGGEPGRRER